MNKRALVLFSGGFDSTYLAYLYLKKGWDVVPFFFYAKHPMMLCLLPDRASCFLRAMPTLGTMRPTVYAEYVYDPDARKFAIPARNLHMLSCAVQQALIEHCSEVGIGSYEDTKLESNFCGDKGRAFTNSFRKTLDYCKTGIKIKSLRSFGVCEKASAIRRVHKAGLLPSFVCNTRWCLNGSGKINDWGYGCGTCVSCRIFSSIFKDEGIESLRIFL